MAKIVKCKTCGNDIASNAKACPNCGAKNKKPFYTKVWFWCLIVIFIAIGAGSSGNTQTSSGESSKSAMTNTDSVKKEDETKKEKFELVGDITNETDEFAVYLSGVIKNNSGKDCSYVQIQFNLYDKDGNQVGTAIDNINNLEKDGTWKFKAMGMSQGEDIGSYKLAEITGF